MDRKEVDHITVLLNMAANEAAQNYPSLKTAISDIVETYNNKISHAQRASVIAILKSFQDATLMYQQKVLSN